MRELAHRGPWAAMFVAALVVLGVPPHSLPAALGGPGGGSGNAGPLGSPPVAVAGGPYAGVEGSPITFDGSGSYDPDGDPLEYRWDFDGDGAWDTDWSTSPRSEFTWYDEHTGNVVLQVRSLGAERISVANEQEPVSFGAITAADQKAESFVPGASTITRISVNVAQNSCCPPPDDDLHITIRASLDGPDLVRASIPYTALPIHVPHWVDLDIPDLAVDPDVTYFLYYESSPTGINSVYELWASWDSPNGTLYSRHHPTGWQADPFYDALFRIWTREFDHAADSDVVTIVNVPPSVTLSVEPGAEGELSVVRAQVFDPGSDVLLVSWDFGFGHMETRTYPAGPGHTWANDTASHVYGDNGAFPVTVAVEDDDGGTAVAEASIDVPNVAPAIEFIATPAGDEADTLVFQARITDPGSDDITVAWSGACAGWSPPVLYPNDPSVVPDPKWSPDVHPRHVTDSQAVVCGDDGSFAWSVVAVDDDGGFTTMSGTFDVANLPPFLAVSPPTRVVADEGTLVSLTATATDPGSDDLTFEWSWAHGPTEARVYFSDGVGPDSPGSPNGTYPFTAMDTSTHTYGDDCACTVTLTISDDDGGILTYVTTVEVVNVPPTIVGAVAVTATADLTLRVAGEKWHDVTLALYDAGTLMTAARIVRIPGSPDEQAVTVAGVVIDVLSSRLSATVEYTPLDDPVNGQPLGATPVWLTLSSRGFEARLHHTFNVRHPQTWTWQVDDFRPLLVGLPIDFEATAADPGSDDLSLTWSWGDGSPSESRMYHNDGIGPDPFPSPGVNPIRVADRTIHVFPGLGPYVVTVTVSDDDGGVALATFVVSFG